MGGYPENQNIGRRTIIDPPTYTQVPHALIAQAAEYHTRFTERTVIVVCEVLNSIFAEASHSESWS